MVTMHHSHYFPKNNTKIAIFRKDTKFCTKITIFYIEIRSTGKETSKKIRSTSRMATASEWKRKPWCYPEILYQWDHLGSYSEGNRCNHWMCRIPPAQNGQPASEKKRSGGRLLDCKAILESGALHWSSVDGHRTLPETWNHYYPFRRTFHRQPCPGRVM